MTASQLDQTERRSEIASRNCHSSALLPELLVWLAVFQLGASAQVLLDGGFETLPFGSAPSVNVPAGAWRFPQDYVAGGVGEKNVGEFTIMAIPRGGQWLHLSAAAGDLGNQHLSNILTTPVDETAGTKIIVSFDIRVESGAVAGGGVYLGNGGLDAVTQRGPQLHWRATGELTTVGADGIETVLVASYTRSAWQSVRLDVDLIADSYNVYWGPRGSTLLRVGQDLEFRSRPQNALDRFTIARFTVDPVVEASFDNFSVIQTIPLNEALDTPAWNWTTWGDAAWGGQAAFTHDMVDAAESGLIGDNEETRLQTSLTGPGTLTFWWKVSCEDVGDYLYFFSGSEFRLITGDVDWQMETVNIPEGQHNVTWGYSKNSSNSEGADQGWVDDVRFEPGPTVPVFLVSDGDFGFRSNQFGFNISGQAGQTFVVEASTNLFDWDSIRTNIVTSSPLYWSDPDSATGLRRFYRLRLLP